MEPLTRRTRDSIPVRGFRPDIEGLRAIAVLLVVLYHAGVPLLTGGYVGVSVFFVISGFLITMHLFQELDRTGTLRLRRFYARRARRLLPAASVVLLATVIASWVLVSGLYAAEVGIDGIWSALFGANIHFAAEGIDYQANEDPSVFQHYWSLSTEEQFYLVWPVLLLAVSAVATMLAPRRTRRRIFVIVVLVLGVASFVLSQVLMQTASTMAYFLMPSRAWELALGGLIALGASWLVKQAWLQNGAVALLGLVMLIGSGFLFTDATPYPGTAALLPTVGTALVIASGLRRGTWAESRLLAWKPLQLIGKLSYSLYLWHWPALILAPMVLGRTLSVVDNIVLCGLSFMLAIFTYIAVEEPFRTSPGLQARPWKSLLFGAITVGVVLSVSAAAVYVGPMRYRTGEVVAQADRDEIVNAVMASAGLTTVPGNLSPSLDAVSKDKPDLNAADGISCMVDLLTSDVSSEPGGTCVAGGTENGDKTIVLVGDSHAYQWMPALRQVALDRGWRLVSLTKGGCAFWDVELVNTNLKRDFTECYAWRENAAERIRAENPDLIVTSAAIFNPRPGDFSDRWVAGVTTGTETLVSMGAPVYVIEDTPYPKVDIPKCIAKSMTDISACGLSPEDAYSDNDRRIRSAEAAAAAGATLIDPYRWFCSSELCPTIIGNTVVYSDNSHVSQTYSTLLGTVLGKELPL
jgi:peptidoglycan/LPS O-acetylase OafA/YrhL